MTASWNQEKRQILEVGSTRVFCRRISRLHGSEPLRRRRRKMVLSSELPVRFTGQTPTEGRFCFPFRVQKHVAVAERRQSENAVEPTTIACT